MAKRVTSPNSSVHPDMDDEPNVGEYRPNRTFTRTPSEQAAYVGWLHRRSQPGPTLHRHRLRYAYGKGMEQRVGKGKPRYPIGITGFFWLRGHATTETDILSKFQSDPLQPSHLSEAFEQRWPVF